MWSISTEKPPVIVVEQESNETCRFAGAELARYLGTVLGAELVVDSADSGPRICLTLADDDELGDEGYEFSVSGDTFRISSGGGAGIVYGVYEFLRLYCGCRFSGLGADGEYVPRRREIEIADPPADTSRSCGIAAFSSPLASPWTSWSSGSTGWPRTG